MLRRPIAFALLLVLAPVAGAAQQDPAARLRATLPSDVADRVLALIAATRNAGLPDAAVAQLALLGVARGVPGETIARVATEYSGDLARAQNAIRAGGRQPTAVEIRAGAEAGRMGVTGWMVSAIARATPSGRSLVVPLTVTGALVQRGLPADEALTAVTARLDVLLDDARLTGLPAEPEFGPCPEGRGGLAVGRGPGPMDVPASGMVPPRGPPPGVPANGGTAGKRPATPPGRSGG